MKSFVTCAFVALFLALSPGSLFAIPNGWEDAKSLPVECDGRASIAIDSKHNSHLVCTYIQNIYDKNIRYAKLKANGTLLSSFLLTTSNSADGAKILIDVNDNLHIMGYDHDLITDELRLFYLKLDTNGSILIPKQYVTPGISLAPFEFVEPFEAVVDLQGRVHLLWNWNDQYYYRQVNGTNLGNILTLTNTGPGGWADGYDFSIAVDSANVAHLVWVDDATNNLLHKKVNNNGTFSAVSTLAISPNLSGFFNYSKTRLTIDSLDHLRVVWSDAAPAGMSIRYQEFTINPILPSSPQITFPVESGWFNTTAYIAVDSAKIAYLLWEDAIFPTDPLDGFSVIKYVKVKSGGQVMTPPTVLSIADLISAYSLNITMNPLKSVPNVSWRALSSSKWKILLKRGEIKPVLLVHGTYSDDTIWGSLEEHLTAEGFTVFRVGKINGKKGLVPNNGDINELKLQIKSAIAEIKAQLGVEKVDVIAHSMGGLASRAYIHSNGYQDDIKNLVMLGTPNFGTPVAKNHLSNLLPTLFSGDILEDFARLQQIPGSRFLHALNHKYETKGVKHFSFAGTQLTQNKIPQLAICDNEPSFCVEGPNRVISDTIVPKKSAAFSAAGCVETFDTHSVGLGDAYYTNFSTLVQIVDVLKDPDQPLFCSLSASIPEADTVEHLTATSNIAPGQELTAVASYNGGKGFQAFLESSSNQLSMKLITPTGLVLNASSCASFPGVTCDKEVSASKTVESISVPETLATGLWQVKVNAAGLTAPTSYTQHLFIGRPVQVAAATDASIYPPNGLIKLFATVTDDAMLLIPGVTVAAKVTDPLGAITILPLYDDGTHGDEHVADGIFSNSFSTTNVQGLYLYEAIATGVVLGSSFTVISKTSAFVETAPDLVATSPKLTLTVPSGGNVAALSASFKNIGDTTAPNVVVDFYAEDLIKGGKVLIGQFQAGSIAPNQTVTASINWNISVGKAGLSAFPSDTNLFQDRDYSNELASATLDSCRWIKNLTPPSRATLCASLQVPTSDPSIGNSEDLP
jgi:pimeloyl-ACP methyl ester carboxylesterase